MRVLINKQCILLFTSLPPTFKTWSDKIACVRFCGWAGAELVTKPNIGENKSHQNRIIYTDLDDKNPSSKPFDICIACMQTREILKRPTKNDWMPSIMGKGGAVLGWCEFYGIFSLVSGRQVHQSILQHCGLRHWSCKQANCENTVPRFTNVESRVVSVWACHEMSWVSFLIRNIPWSFFFFCSRKNLLSSRILGSRHEEMPKSKFYLSLYQHFSLNLWV